MVIYFLSNLSEDNFNHIIIKAWICQLTNSNHQYLSSKRGNILTGWQYAHPHEAWDQSTCMHFYTHTWLKHLFMFMYHLFSYNLGNYNISHSHSDQSKLNFFKLVYSATICIAWLLKGSSKVRFLNLHYILM